MKATTAMMRLPKETSNHATD
jgi:hypothetical protein